MMKTLIAFFLFVHSLVALSETELTERSELWPTFCYTQESIVVDEAEIEAQTRGVLIRLEGNGSRALVDFGRQGVHLVSISSLGFIVRAPRIEQGDLVKRFPNLVELLASRIIQVQGGEAKRLSQDEYAEIERFICIRFEDTDKGWTDVSIWLDEQREAIQSPEQIVLLFPFGNTLSDEQMLNRITTHEIPDVSYLYSFLSSSYQRLLWYGLESGDPVSSALEFDSNGKLLERYKVSEMRL
jgi:hypothetical protein